MTISTQRNPVKTRPALASERLLDQLSSNSAPYDDPLTRINWDALDQNDFWLPKEAVSLYGLPEFDALSEEQQRALSQYEFLNFVEAGIWLESLFMSRIGQSLARDKHRLSELIYHLHELREEAGHSLMFLELLRRSGPLLPNTSFYKWNLPNILARYAPFDSLPFWVAVLCGEEIPDRMNRFIRKHKSEINPVIYDMVSIHIIDEARHIAHAKDTVERRIVQTSRLRRALIRPIINRVFRQFVLTFYFPGSHIYQMAGLDPSKNWVKLARNNPNRIEFVDQCVNSSLRTLRQLDLTLNWR